jgi:hypothetical protein
MDFSDANISSVANNYLEEIRSHTREGEFHPTKEGVYGLAPIWGPTLCSASHLARTFNSWTTQSYAIYACFNFPKQELTRNMADALNLGHDFPLFFVARKSEKGIRVGASSFTK